MSVINSVLKDLEAKTSRFTPIDIASVDNSSKYNWQPMSWFALIALLVGATLWAWMSLHNNPVNAANSPLATIPLKPAVVIEAEVAEVATIPNEIIGLQIRESEDDMSLEFSLRDKVVSYLKERGENSFVYHLKNVDSQIVAPVMHGNRWIQQLSLISLGDGVDINFKTAAGILVETRQQQLDGEQIWTIRLKTPLAAVDPAAVEPENGVPELIDTPTEAVMVVEPAPATKIVKLDIKSTNPNAKSGNQLQYALELIQSNRFRDAETLLLNLLGGAEDLLARQRLLALYDHQKRADQFSELVRESMAEYPAEAIFKTEYARSLFQLSAYRSVVDLLSDGHISDANQQALLAASYQRLDQHEQAAKYYRLALALDERNAKNWIGLGISQEHNAALEDALHSYQTAAKLGNLTNRLQAFIEKRSRTLEKVVN